MCAKSEKPKRSADGFYWFICEYCSERFPAKNITAKTCSQTCRSAKNDELRRILQATELDHAKEYIYNAKVLRKLFMLLKDDPVNEQTLQLMEFNNKIDALTIEFENLHYKKFGDFLIGKVKPGQYKIIPSWDMNAALHTSS